MLYEVGVLGEQNALFNNADFPEPIKHLIENVTDGIVIFDQHGSIIHSNKPLQVMLGLGDIDIRQLSLSDIDVQYCNEQHSSAFEYLSNVSGNIKSRLAHKNSTTFPVKFSPIVTTLNNQPIALVIVKRISGEKEIEPSY